MFLRIHEWREENERLGLEPTISDFWTAEQRETYLRDWLDDSDVLEAIRGEKRTRDEMMDEGPSTSHSVNEEVLQAGRGEVDDNERPFYIESVRQVYTKKFKTNATSYRIQFTSVLANDEITSLHERLHEIFQQILYETVGGVPPQDQVRFVLHSNQLDKPIHFPFMPAERLTTEQILAKFEQVIQSNQEFRLNDTVEINVIHVSMPIGGKRSKRSEVNLGKHLEKKRSVVRIRNDDDLRMARALVVAKAKLDNDPRDRQIRDHRWPMQTRLARELHQNANVPLGPCGIEQAKLFQAYLTEYQINIVSKEYENKIIYAGPEKDKKITSTTTTITMTSSPRCLGFLHATTIVTRVRKSMITLKITFARTNASVVDLFPFVPRSLGDRVVIAVDSSRVSDVTISTSNLEAAPVPYVRV